MAHDIKSAVLTAARAIAANCDGAIDEDGIGYNGTDTKFGKRVAALPAQQVTTGMVNEAAAMLVKYKDQIIAAVGEEIYNQITTHANTHERDVEARQDARRATYAEETRNGRQVDVHEGEFILTMTKFDATSRNDMKANVPGRRFDWDTKVWSAPLTSAAHVLAWAAKFDAEVTDAARIVAENVASSDAPAKVNDNKVVKITDDEVWLSAPYGAVSIDAWRAVPGRRWNAYNKVNVLPLRPSTLEFMVEHGFDSQDKVSAALQARADVDLAKEREQEANRAASAAEDAAQVTLDGQSEEWSFFGYQNAGIRQMVKLGDVLLGDEMGVGKTAQAIGAVEMSGDLPAIVVCPPVVRGNWEREWHKIVPGRKIMVAHGATPWMISSDTEVVVVSDASIAEWLPALLDWVGERKGSVIVDECHRMKHGTLMDGKRASGRAQAVELLCEQVGA